MRTYRGIPVQGQFLASDSEGEDMTFTLVEEPRKGTVTIQGADFTYTPDEGVTGGDSFTYAATDSAGHISQPATVTVTIEKTKSGVTYADTQGSPAAAAAQHLAEAGIFTGGKAAIVDDASFTAICKSSTPSGGLQSAAGFMAIAVLRSTPREKWILTFHSAAVHITTAFSATLTNLTIVLKK